MALTVLLCGSPRCVLPATLEALKDTAHAAIQHHHLQAQVFVVSCVELCQRGPHVVLHGAKGDVAEEARAPDGGVAYDAVTAEGMARIMEEHALGGVPVQALLHRDVPGRVPPR